MKAKLFSAIVIASLSNATLCIADTSSTDSEVEYMQSAATFLEDLKAREPIMWPGYGGKTIPTIFAFSGGLLPHYYTLENSTPILISADDNRVKNALSNIRNGINPDYSHPYLVSVSPSYDTKTQLYTYSLNKNKENLIWPRWLSFNLNLVEAHADEAPKISYKISYKGVEEEAINAKYNMLKIAALMDYAKTENEAALKYYIAAEESRIKDLNLAANTFKYKINETAYHIQGYVFQKSLSLTLDEMAYEAHSLDRELNVIKDSDLSSLYSYWQEIEEIDISYVEYSKLVGNVLGQALDKIYGGSSWKKPLDFSNPVSIYELVRNHYPMNDAEIASNLEKAKILYNFASISETIDTIKNAHLAYIALHPES